MALHSRLPFVSVNADDHDNSSEAQSSEAVVEELTPMHIAAIEDDHSALRALHNQRRDIRLAVTPVYRCTILHLVLQSLRPPLDVVSLLIRSNPEMGVMKNAEGNTALHEACYKLQSFDVIETLLAACPWALALTNKEGHDPLTAACSSGASLDVVQLLSEVLCPPCTETLELKMRLEELEILGKFFESYQDQRKGWHEKYCPPPILDESEGKPRRRKWHTPIHGACGSAAPVEVVAYLSARHPEFLSVRDEKGNTPLHVAFTENASNDVKKELIDCGPEALKATNKLGLAPYECCTLSALFRFIHCLQKKEHYLLRDRHWNNLAHLVFMYNAPHELKRKVMEEFPIEALAARNRRGMTPLDYAAVEDLYDLFRNHPDMVMPC